MIRHCITSSRAVRALFASAVALAATRGAAEPVQASAYDDTAYADVDVVWFEGTTSGGAGLEHDDVIYPERLELSGRPAQAFPLLEHDDGAYPSSAILAQVGVGRPTADDAEVAAAGGEPGAWARR